MRTKIKLNELLNFSRNEKQERAKSAVKNKKYVLYGGAMGGGKSYWLRWMLVYFLIKWAQRGNTGVEVGLFCEDYPTLKDRQISKISKEFPSWLGSFHADHKEHGKCFILDEEYGSGIIKFRNLDDPSKYQSAEFAAIAVDELTKNPFGTFEDLRNRLRWTGIEDVRFIAGTNPGGIGHAWVKKYWIDRDFPPEETEPEQFMLIQAVADDNPYLAETYLKQLDSLTPDKRRAYREGDWDIFKGQYFPEFRREIHVVEPFEIPSEWMKFLMGDYGLSAPTAGLWGALSPDNDLYIYRELYETGLNYSQATDLILASYPESEELRYWVFDPAIWSKQAGDVNAFSGAEIMQNRFTETRSNGLKKAYLQLQKGNNDRLNGWQLLREYLKPIIRNGQTTAKLKIFSTCTNLIRTLPSLVYDKHKVEDLDTDGEDHCADALRYGIMSRPKPTLNREEIGSREFQEMIKRKRQALKGKRLFV